MLQFGRTIPLRIYPSFWILVLGLGWMMNQGIEGILLFGLVAFISLIVHEFGHAASALYFGQQSEIELTLFGGATVRNGPSLGLMKELLVILLGPIASIALVILSALMLRLYPNASMMTSFFYLMFIANIFWTAVNLLPVQPLDGGRIMTIIFLVLSPKNGRRWAYLVSALFGLIASIFFFSTGSVFAGAIFMMCFWESFQAYRNYQDEGESESYSQELDEIQKMVDSGRQQDAIFKLKALVEKSVSKTILSLAFGQLAQIYLLRESPREAYEVIQQAKVKLHSQLPYDLLVIQQLASYRTSHFQESFDAGNTAFRVRPELSTALLLAMAAAQLHLVEETILWLKSCRSLGFVDFEKLLECSDFDSVRHEEGIQSFKV